MDDAAIARLDWPDIFSRLEKDGFALLRGLLSMPDLESLNDHVNARAAHDPHQSLEVLKLGRGTRYYHNDCLPAQLKRLPGAFYEQLAPIANRWRRPASTDPTFSESYLEPTEAPDRLRPPCHVTSHHLHGGDFLTLHHDIGGESAFPIKLVMLLSATVADFTGGEFVMVEQRPRMQSRPVVVQLVQGDIALISVAERPCIGAKGVYRVKMRHAISPVGSGVRVSVDILFHAPLGSVR